MVSSAINELDKFTRFFIQKAAQVIVQSRLGAQRIKTTCNPVGNDWFNLAIPDLKEISDEVKRCTDHMKAGVSICQKWTVCCEISLKTSEGDSMVLENWILSNEPSGEEVQPVSSNPSLTVYSRMSMLLKSIITLTRATPAYKISCRDQGTDLVICYRVFETTDPMENIVDASDKFSPEAVIGAISSNYNTLSMSLVYRKDLSTTGTRQQSANLMPLKPDHFIDHTIDKSTRSRVPAFASSPGPMDTQQLQENIFLSLLVENKNIESGDEVISGSIDEKRSDLSKADDSISQLSSTSDSFVFVETPFAPHEQRVFGSFFNGPTPSFRNCQESPSKLGEQLASLESSVHQWDSFVDSVCTPSNEESVISSG